MLKKGPRQKSGVRIKHIKTLYPFKLSGGLSDNLLLGYPSAPRARGLGAISCSNEGIREGENSVGVCQRGEKIPPMFRRDKTKNKNYEQTLTLKFFPEIYGTISL